MKNLLSGFIIGCLFVPLVIFPAISCEDTLASTQEVRFRQLDTHWSDHVGRVLLACSQAAFVEREMALIQGATPQQEQELSEGVYWACIHDNQVAI
jgi:hypothetical protein